MNNKTEKRTAKGNVIKNDLTGKEATIERREDRAVIISKSTSKAEIPETKTGNSAAMHVVAKAEQKPEAKAKAEKKPKAKAKAKPKAKKEASPLRKITLSRTTMRVTIPSEARDDMLKSLNVRLEDLKAKRSLTTWDSNLEALVTRIVKAEEGQ